MHSGDGRLAFEGAAGAAQVDQPFFIASITKMFTGAAVIQLADEGALGLDDRVAAHLPHLELAGLHVVAGVDHTETLTLRHLLHQTSGLADYYEGMFLQDMLAGRDRAFEVADAVEMARGLRPMSAPDSGRAQYSDTNFQLLGAVIEAATGQDLPTVFAAGLFEPLGLSDTYLFDHRRAPDRAAPVPLYHKAKRLEVPLALSSMRPDGAGVWTLGDAVRFLRVYFGGALFDPSNLSAMTAWKPAFFPIQYGYGIMRFRLPRWMNLFRATTEFVGHSGTCGAWAFFAPAEDVFLVGSVSQMEAKRVPYQVLPQVIEAIKTARAA